MDLNKWKFLFRSMGFIFLMVQTFSCSVSPKRASSDLDLSDKFRSSQIFDEAFSAMVLFDPVKDEVLFDHNGEKLFTPASNTKIATLLSTLELLGDSLPLIEYADWKDVIFMKGTANPLHLNPNFSDNQQLNEWVESFQDKSFCYLPADPQPSKYGSGWAWDDYLYDYQLDNCAFPIYGNQLTLKSDGRILELFPGKLGKEMLVQRAEYNRFYRSFHSNEFHISVNNKAFERVLPFYWTDSLALALWENEVALNPSSCPGIRMPENLDWHYLMMPFPDSLYIRLMQESDNFIAEQLLLCSAGFISDTLDRSIAIREATELWEPLLRDSMRWVDGSGLSRYNLFSPYTFVQLLDRLYDLKSWEWIEAVFPQGGQSGSIEAWYDENVHAKTGTLSNNHNLSGFIEVRSGRVLIFSFMHNHFLGSNRRFKTEMQDFLRWIENNY